VLAEAKKGKKGLPNAPKSPKMLSKTPKIIIHVAVDASINSVVENKPVNPHKIRDCGFFYDSTF